MPSYKVKEVTPKGESVFILLDGEACIREGNKVSDEKGNVFEVKAVMSICAGCTMCSDTMLNVRLVKYCGEIGCEISGGIV